MESIGPQDVPSLDRLPVLGGDLGRITTQQFGDARPADEVCVGTGLLGLVAEETGFHPGDLLDETDDTDVANIVKQKMPHFANNIEFSLAKLAELSDIAIKFGWKGQLAESLGVKLTSISTWIRRNSIPKRQITAIQEAGYPPDAWLSVVPPTEKAVGIEEAHAHVIRRFDNKVLACELNQKLLQIEQENPEVLNRVKAYLDGILEGLKAEKRKKKEKEEDLASNG